jgi:transposase-like protein
MARSMYTRSERARLVGRWERSGLSAAAFGARVGVNAQTLYGWRRLRSRRARMGEVDARSGPAVRFIDVTPQPDAAPGGGTGDAAGLAAAPVEVILGSGDVLRIGTGADEHLLRTVIAALRGESGAPTASPDVSREARR